MNDDEHRDWQNVSAALRKAGVSERPAEEDLSAPSGFATRVVARYRADQRADNAGLSLWRRWSLAGAACAVLLFGGGFLIKPPAPPAEPIIPVPALDLPTPGPAQR